ncbi:MAG: DUF4857 domain-containing protein [Clostridium sp.]|nr:DUF4857 domain-containing protein [Clostridium sp.]
MKTCYRILVYAFGVCALAWFLPWLYSFAFPSAGSEPFVAYSPIADAFVISENGDKLKITIDGQDGEFTKEERDSLLPQIYFTQLMGREKLPDSIAGKEVSVPIFRHSQWVFTSLPMDIKKVQPSWHLMMESMPKRYDLEDPTEAFTLENGAVEFVTMADNQPNEKRSARFTKAFADKGFAYPAAHMSANITARKAYDDGYLMVDADGGLFHVKMRAGTPYVAKVAMPAKSKYAFVQENMDKKVLGLVFDEENNLYALENNGYKAYPMGISFDPARCRVSVMANLFNIVVRSRDSKGIDWWAVDSDTYQLLGHYRYDYPKSKAEEVAEWIFPFRLSFTDVDDSYAYPRITDVSPKALILGLVLAIVGFFIGRRCNRRPAEKAAIFAGDVLFGIYFFIISLFRI